MFIKKRKSSTEPTLRSLLQKAARRGDERVLESTARRLIDIGDKTWLRSRAAVITFEEAWPVAVTLALDRSDDSKVQALLNVARSSKQKDAAGLGALAYAYHEGDETVASSTPELKAVRIVAEALDRPAQFFAWLLSSVHSETSTAVIRAAQSCLASATWGWDKTCILAGAFLASQRGEVLLETRTHRFQGDFPYWIALDKHTPEGKLAIKAVAARLALPYRQVIWSGFYVESAATDHLTHSPWWEIEKRWRLAKVGLSVDSAEQIWEIVRPVLRAELAVEEAFLRERMSKLSASQISLM